MKKTLSLICILSVILIGCTDSDIINSPADTYSVEFLGEFELTTFEGIERDLPFTVLVRDADSLAADGVPVKLTLTGAEGSFSPTEAITDENGMVEAVMTVKASHGKSTAHIIIKAGESTQVQEVEITGRGRPSSIQIYTSTPSPHHVIPDQNLEIEFRAIIIDENGINIPDSDLIHIKYSIHPVEPDSEIFGIIIQTSSTNATFNTMGGSGKIIIAYEVEEFIGTEFANSGSIKLTVELLTSEIHELTVHVNPGYMLLPEDTIGTAIIYARVVDQDNNGIPNMRVNFNCQYGTIGSLTLTDSTGLATAQYYIRPIWDFPKDENGNILDVITDNIRAVIPNTAFVKYTSITVEKTAGDRGNLTLTSDVDFIYADNGRTVANLQVVLKDANNQAMVNREIILTSTHGTVNSSVVTDSMGVAHAIFTDIGLPSTDEHGNIVPSLITAIYNPLSLSASIEITIKERNPIATISLQAAEDQLMPNSNDSTALLVICFSADGGFAPEGDYEVFFECNKGHVERGFYFSDFSTGTAHIQAHIDNGDTIIYSNTVEIEIIPGPLARLELSYDPEYRRITATLYDRLGNRMGSGWLVTFSTTLGSLDRVSASTNENGEASVGFRPGVYVGVTVITATVGGITAQIEVEIPGNGSRSIELRADPTQIPVGGQSTLTVYAWNSDHDPYIENGVVYLQILYEPPRLEGGCYFENGEQLVSLEFENGEASVILHAGQAFGGRLIKLYAVFDDNPQDTLSLLSRVSIVAGVPAYIDVDFNEDGINGEGGTWICEVSARVFDRYMNPVSDSIPVVFSCDSVAQIGAGFTGNESSGGVTTPGVAYGSLTYNSEDTFDTLTITAEVNSPSGIKRGELRAQLPLQEGSLTLEVTPAIWDIEEDTVAVFTCQVELRDGHGVLINNAPVMFNASRGLFYWYNHRQGRTGYVMYDYLARPPEPVIKYTGWNLPDHPEHREERGQATVYLMGEEEDFFLDHVTPQVNVQIGAVVDGYDDVIADPVIVVVSRNR